MIDATGHPQTILLLGGTSEIGLAICAEYLASAPARVVLGVQPGDPRREAAVGQLRARGAREVVALDFDATAFETHPDVMAAAWAGGSRCQKSKPPDSTSASRRNSVQAPTQAIL